MESPAVITSDSSSVCSLNTSKRLEIFKFFLFWEKLLFTRFPTSTKLLSQIFPCLSQPSIDVVSRIIHVPIYFASIYSISRSSSQSHFQFVPLTDLIYILRQKAFLLHPFVFPYIAREADSLISIRGREKFLTNCIWQRRQLKRAAGAISLIDNNTELRDLVGAKHTTRCLWEGWTLPWTSQSSIHMGRKSLASPKVSYFPNLCLERTNYLNI